MASVGRYKALVDLRQGKVTGVYFSWKPTQVLMLSKFIHGHQFISLYLGHEQWTPYTIVVEYNDKKIFFNSIGSWIIWCETPILNYTVRHYEVFDLDHVHVSIPSWGQFVYKRQNSCFHSVQCYPVWCSLYFHGYPSSLRIFSAWKRKQESDPPPWKFISAGVTQTSLRVMEFPLLGKQPSVYRDNNISSTV